MKMGQEINIKEINRTKTESSGWVEYTKAMDELWLGNSAKFLCKFARKRP